MYKRQLYCYLFVLLVVVLDVVFVSEVELEFVVFEAKTLFNCLTWKSFIPLKVKSKTNINTETTITIETTTTVFSKSCLPFCQITFFNSALNPDNLLSFLVDFFPDFFAFDFLAFLALSSELTTVSYTHLDVYKRQPLILGILLFAEIIKEIIVSHKSWFKILIPFPNSILFFI